MASDSKTVFENAQAQTQMQTQRQANSNDNNEFYSYEIPGTVIGPTTVALRAQVGTTPAVESQKEGKEDKENKDRAKVKYSRITTYGEPAEEVYSKKREYVITQL